MSEKRRKSVSLDERVASHIDDDDVNFSGLVNQWGQMYYEEDRRPVMSESKGEQLVETLDEIERREQKNHSAKIDVIDQLRELVEENSSGVEAEAMEELAEEFDNIHDMFTTTQRSLKSTGGDERVDWERSPRQPDHVGIRTQASRLGVPPKRLSRELRKRDRRDGYVESARTDGGQPEAER